VTITRRAIRKESRQEIVARSYDNHSLASVTIRLIRCTREVRSMSERFSKKAMEYTATSDISVDRSGRRTRTRTGTTYCTNESYPKSYLTTWYCLRLIDIIYETPRCLYMVTEYCAGSELMEYVAAQARSAYQRCFVDKGLSGMMLPDCELFGKERASCRMGHSADGV